MEIQPYILGSGNAGKAMAKSLMILNLIQNEVSTRPHIWVPRGTALRSLSPGDAVPLLLVANPHGLHARALLEAEQAGFSFVAVEKPACVTRQELSDLRRVRAEVVVFHGYRAMWGPQTIHAMLEKGELGEIICIEGRYWQSSSAQRALDGQVKPSWKNDVALSGPCDTLVDLGVHWADLAVYLFGELPARVDSWTSYVNAEAPHRDTHVHLLMDFARKRRAFASISKTCHGATNELELHVLGSRASASWRFLRPDEIEIGVGRDRRAHRRESSELGSRQPPFHALGWLEGYVEILHQLVRKMSGKSVRAVPTLAEHLAVMDLLLPD